MRHPKRRIESASWPASLRVADCMTRGVATVQADALARGAADMMLTRRIRHLPVVNGDGLLVGIVTDRDLRQALFDPRVHSRTGRLAERLKRMTVAELMTRAVVTTRPETPLAEAARLMHEGKIGALPVVATGRIVGLLSEIDVLKTVSRTLRHGFGKPERWALALR